MTTYNAPACNCQLKHMQPNVCTNKEFSGSSTRFNPYFGWCYRLYILYQPKQRLNVIGLRDYRIWQNIHGVKLLWFFTHHKSFPVNYGLVDWQYKSPTMLQQKFYDKQSFHTQNTNFPTDVFPYTVFIRIKVGFKILYLSLLKSGSNTRRGLKYMLGSAAE